MSADLIIEQAPVGIVLLDEAGQLVRVNAAASRLLEPTPGTSIFDAIHADCRESFDGLLTAGGEAEITLTGRNSSRTVLIQRASEPAEGQRVLFLVDISEKQALARQLRARHEPYKKTLTRIQSANTAMMGYSELITLMLDESESLADERLMVVRRYHKEIRRSQQAIERLLKMARQGGRRPSSAAVPIDRRQVVVVEDEPAIAEYLTELLKSLQHRVTTFTSPIDALDWCRQHPDEVDLLLTDQVMPTMDGLELATRIHELSASIPVLICTEQELEIGAGTQIYQCGKPLDINELIQIVSELV